VEQVKQQSMSSSSTPLRGNTPVLQDEILTPNKIIAYRSVLVSGLHCSPFCAHECGKKHLPDPAKVAHKERSDHRGFACSLNFSRVVVFTSLLPLSHSPSSSPPIALLLVLPPPSPPTPYISLCSTTEMKQ